MQPAQSAARDLIRSASSVEGPGILPVFVEVDSTLELVLDALRETIVASRALTLNQQAVGSVRRSLGMPSAPFLQSDLNGYAREDLPFPTRSRRALVTECVARWMAADLDESVLEIERWFEWSRLGNLRARQVLLDGLPDDNNDLNAEPLPAPAEWLADAGLTLRSEFGTGSLRSNHTAAIRAAEVLNSAMDRVGDDEDTLREFISLLLGDLRGIASKGEPRPRPDPDRPPQLWLEPSVVDVDWFTTPLRVVDWSAAPIWIATEPDDDVDEEPSGHDLERAGGSLWFSAARHGGQRLPRFRFVHLSAFDPAAGQVRRGDAHYREGMFVLSVSTRMDSQEAIWSLQTADLPISDTPFPEPLGWLESALHEFTRRRLNAGHTQGFRSLAERLCMDRSRSSVRWAVSSDTAGITIRSSAAGRQQSMPRDGRGEVWSDLQFRGGRSRFLDPGDSRGFEVTLNGAPESALVRHILGGDVELAARRIAAQRRLSSASDGAYVQRNRYAWAMDEPLETAHSLRAFVGVGLLLGWLRRLPPNSEAPKLHDLALRELHTALGLLPFVIRGNDTDFRGITAVLGEPSSDQTVELLLGVSSRMNSGTSHDVAVTGRLGDLRDQLRRSLSLDELGSWTDEIETFLPTLDPLARTRVRRVGQGSFDDYVSAFELLLASWPPEGGS